MHHSRTVNFAFYDQMTATVNVGSTLYNYASFLVQLLDCTFVMETFTDIYVNTALVYGNMANGSIAGC